MKKKDSNNDDNGQQDLQHRQVYELIEKVIKRCQFPQDVKFINHFTNPQYEYFQLKLIDELQSDVDFMVYLQDSKLKNNQKYFIKMLLGLQAIYKKFFALKSQRFESLKSQLKNLKRFQLVQKILDPVLGRNKNQIDLQRELNLMQLKFSPTKFVQFLKHLNDTKEFYGDTIQQKNLNLIKKFLRLIKKQEIEKFEISEAQSYYEQNSHNQQESEHHQSEQSIVSYDQNSQIQKKRQEIKSTQSQKSKQKKSEVKQQEIKEENKKSKKEQRQRGRGFNKPAQKNQQQKLDKTQKKKFVESQDEEQEIKKQPIKKQKNKEIKKQDPSQIQVQSKMPFIGIKQQTNHNINTDNSTDIIMDFSKNDKLDPSKLPTKIQKKDSHSKNVNNSISLKYTF